jgi:hypothetical protein
MATWLGLDTVTTLTGEAFLLPADVIDVLFPGHLLAAKALQKDIAATHWVEGSEREAKRVRRARAPSGGRSRRQARCVASSIFTTEQSFSHPAASGFERDRRSWNDRACGAVHPSRAVLTAASRSAGRPQEPFQRSPRTPFERRYELSDLGERA